MQQFNVYGLHTQHKRWTTFLSRQGVNQYLGTDNSPRYNSEQLRIKGIAELQQELSDLIDELRQWDKHRFDRHWRQSTTPSNARHKRLRIIHQVIRRDMTVDEANWRRQDDTLLCQVWSIAEFEVDMMFCLRGIAPAQIRL